jgi:hypothetical protein
MMEVDDRMANNAAAAAAAAAAASIRRATIEFSLSPGSLDEEEKKNDENHDGPSGLANDVRTINSRGI